MKERLVEVLKANPEKRRELKRALAENNIRVDFTSKNHVIIEAISFMDGTSARRAARQAMKLLLEAAIEEAESA